MNKKSFSEHWSKLVNKYRCGTEILGKDRKFILEACLKTSTYKKNAEKENIKVKVRNITIARGRRVRMLCLELGNQQQPISKSRIVEFIYPTKSRTKKKNTYVSEVRKSMRFLIKDQIITFRKNAKFPRVCPITNSTIKKGQKVDVDHFFKPFIQIADEFLQNKNLKYTDIKLEGPSTAKVFKDKQLQEEWQTYHKENAHLAILLSSTNRSKGCLDYVSPF